MEFLIGIFVGAFIMFVIIKYFNIPPSWKE